MGYDDGVIDRPGVTSSTSHSCEEFTENPSQKTMKNSLRLEKSNTYTYVKNCALKTEFMIFTIKITRNKQYKHYNCHNNPLNICHKEHIIAVGKFLVKFFLFWLKKSFPLKWS
jgi:hypothetical protein